MANVKASKKAVRQTAVRTERNRARKSRVRTFLKKVDDAILAGKNLGREGPALVAVDTARIDIVAARDVLGQSFAEGSHASR